MPTQANRFIELKTPLGDDKLLLRTFAGTEQISRPFQFDIEMDSEDAELAFEDIVGQKACVRADLASGDKRWFHGIVSRFVQTHTDGRHSSYKATLVPWLWLLTRTSDCRIFQNKSTPDILKEVFGGHGFSEYELRLSGTYDPWEYCVQYRETDFNFVSRLMEQEGIYYYFEHSESEHKLILADSPAAHSEFPNYGSLVYRPPRHDKEEREETVTSWLIEKEVQTGTYALTDYNFKTPNVSLAGKSTIARSHEKADYEIFDYPGEYEVAGDAENYAKVRVEELQAQYETLRGQASARGVASGAKFALTDHPRDDQNREYLVLSTNIRMSTGDYESGHASNDFFSCSFAAIPFENPFRPLRSTPKPSIQGPQTAFVVGPSGEEIHTDEFGRIKLQFHWDRHGKSDENSSCWIRVSQFAWAGEKWGGIHIPRIGQEVIVEFLEGDPDRPLVTGRVYNAKTTVPYDLPANKTQSGIKSRSTKGGNDANFNEIRFEDLKGAEQIYIHAEKDKRVEVENDRSEDVGHDETIHVGNDRTETVDANEKISIGKNRTEDIGGDETISISGNRTESVEKDERITIEGARTTDITKSETISISDARTETVEKDETITIKKNRKVEVNENDEQNIGKKFALIAGDQIQLQTGDASIIMKKDGTIEIKGKDIKISGSGKISVKADSDVTIKGSSTKIN